uniref:Uncharacterized protein n=1 Tax=Globodera rostochiensis TaxID=31243 RepID=A0A914I229_GLORO
MKLYAFVLIGLAILALSAICKAGKKEEEAVKDEVHPMDVAYDAMYAQVKRKNRGKAWTQDAAQTMGWNTQHYPDGQLKKQKHHGEVLNACQKITAGPGTDNNPCKMKEDTTPYGQEPSSNPSDTHDYTTPYAQEPSSNPSDTHDYTTPYGQEPSSNASFQKNDDMESQGQAPYSNLLPAIDYHTNEYEDNEYWYGTHHPDDTLILPHHGNDYNWEYGQMKSE